jgi:hypothetical protein
MIIHNVLYFSPAKFENHRVGRVGTGDSRFGRVVFPGKAAAELQYFSEREEGVKSPGAHTVRGALPDYEFVTDPVSCLAGAFLRYYPGYYRIHLNLL